MCRHGPVSPVAGAGDHIVTSYWVRKQAEQAEPAFAPGRSQLTPSVILVLDTGTRAPWRPDRRHCTHSPRPRHQPLPRRPLSPYHACRGQSKPVLSPSKGAPKRSGAAAPCRSAHLRANVAKCRRMSHYFTPPLVNPCNLRVENLTFWADSRPFWPISDHFRVRPPSFLCAATGNRRVGQVVNADVVGGPSSWIPGLGARNDGAACAYSSSASASSLSRSKRQRA